MIRARFSVNADDPRPVNWPIKHPYWVTGYGINHATIVAYADDQREIMTNWPDAHNLDFTDEVDGYTFTDRFAKPKWFVENLKDGES
ncbi:hypothetical protein [Burkholderia lata]|uniref:Uncharacterized protein n=1 Tax=Burkholderia lata (strain ATCC 17760 / DSM 23089 / LMG 22485 / NCIMB 9086 / R18194 / 383) TaxID=482957 RepID=A0A6P2GY83_BURL3|nr:hypothetical protein [Burkholderia lata]VWB08571.1 hypothetical protein BLA6863_00224 [Burkholderia lata]